MACGGGGSAAKDIEDPSDGDRDRGAPRISEDEEPDDGLELQSTRGKMDPDDIQAGIDANAATMQDCFLSRVGKQRWLGGRIFVKWEMAADGTLTSAQLTESDLGAWPVEKCILDVARAIPFAPPRGGPTDFTIDFTFDGKKEAGWWDEEVAANVLGKKLATLEACAADAGTADPTDVTVTLYVGNRGKVQSVGFASPAVIDDAWATCAETTVLGWQLTDPKGKVVKAAVVYRPGETPVPDEEW